MNQNIIVVIERSLFKPIKDISILYITIIWNAFSKFSPGISELFLHISVSCRCVRQKIGPVSISFSESSTMNPLTMLLTMFCFVWVMETSAGRGWLEHMPSFMHSCLSIWNGGAAIFPNAKGSKWKWKAAFTKLDGWLGRCVHAFYPSQIQSASPEDGACHLSN